MTKDPLTREPGWQLAERVTERVLGIYRNTFGSLEALEKHAGPAMVGPRGPAATINAKRVPDLALLTSAAINGLAAHANIASGRAPLKPADWRVILYGFLGGRTLREAISRAIDCFEAIDWRCGRMALHVQGSLAFVEQDPMRPRAPTVADCMLDIFGINQTHGMLRWLIGRDMTLDIVLLAHSRETFEELALSDLPFEVGLDSTHTGFGFDAALLDHPVVRTLDELALRPPSLLFSGASARRLPQSTVDSVRAIALRQLREQHRLPSFADVAATTGHSAPTLRRHLAREGSSYRQIRESCRRELALDLLRRTTIPVEEIAARLDFYDSDTLRQAFRKWVGVTPSQYRQQVIRARASD